MKKLLGVTSAVLALVVGLLASAPASANVIQIGSQAGFSARGTLATNTNWDSYGPGFSYPGSPFVVGDLTFVAGSPDGNLIGGTGPDPDPDSGNPDYRLARNLLTDNNVQGTTALVNAGAYDLLGFNAGNFFGSGPATFEMTTNFGSYTFGGTVQDARDLGALSFHGFQADPGEYFTSFKWSGGNATGITDVQLGVASAVPEPMSLVLLGAGLIGLGLIRRKLG